MSTAVAVRGLVKAYGKGPPAVDGVQLDVAPGALVALLGPSGCGKTTTLKAIAGLLDPDGGDVLFDATSVTGVPPERREVAMVFQKPLLFPHLSVARNVGFGLRMRRMARPAIEHKVAEMLDLVRLSGLGERRAAELSGGQEQRVSLARALVTEPKVLLLDEPLSQLDANLRADMRDLVRTVQRQVGVTTLFVTHDQEEAVSLADRIALMLAGRVVQEGEPRDFYERPASVAVARFLGGRNFLPGAVCRGMYAGPVGPVPVTVTWSGPAVLLIRQEAVEVVASGTPGAVPALARSATYLGTHTQVEAELNGSLAVHLVVDPSQRIAPGDRVHLRFPPERCHVVPDDSGTHDGLATTPPG